MTSHIKDQVKTVSVDLLPSKLNRNLKRNIDEELARNYINQIDTELGYVRSVETLQYNIGVSRSNNFTGSITYSVTCRFRTVLPLPGDELTARVIEVNKDNYVLARDVPVDVMLYRDTFPRDQYQLFEQIQVGDYVRVQVRMVTTSPDNRYLTICSYMSRNISEGKFTLPSLLSHPTLDANTVNYIPEPILSLGYSSDLDLIREKIEDYDRQVNSYKDFTAWKLMSYMANPYELIDNMYYAGIKESHGHAGTASGEGSYPVSKLLVRSRAFYKIWEILFNYTLLPTTEPANILCLAEAPGGFIQSIWQYREKTVSPDIQSKDHIYANTRRAHVIQADGSKFFIKNSIDWEKKLHHISLFEEHTQQIHLDHHYGADGTGNLISQDNLLYLRDTFTHGIKMDLITADGGIDVDLAHHNQEQMNADLIWSECLAALLCQKLGGSFVVKVYEITTQFTSDVICMMSQFYATTGVFKPLTSRPSNTERYVIFQNFLGAPEATVDYLLDKLRKWEGYRKSLEHLEFVDRNIYLSTLINWDSVPEGVKQEWQAGIERQNLHFNSHALESINTAISFYPQKIRDTATRLAVKSNQRSIAIAWAEKYDIPHYNAELELDALKVDLNYEPKLQSQMLFEKGKKTTTLRSSYSPEIAAKMVQDSPRKRYIPDEVISPPMGTNRLSKLPSVSPLPPTTKTMTKHTAKPIPFAPPALAPPALAPPTLAPPALAPPTLAPPTLAPPTLAPPTLAPPALAPSKIVPLELPTLPFIPSTLAPSALAPPALAPPALAPPVLAPPTRAPPAIPTLAPSALPKIAPLELPTLPFIPSTLAPPTLAPPTLAPPTLAPPTLAPPTLAPLTLPTLINQNQLPPLL